MMTVLFTCPQCSSGIHVVPSVENNRVKCDICAYEFLATFTQDHENGVVKDCPLCLRKDFYIQKDFNRKVGVFLFIVAAILSIYTYGLSLVALYIVDLLLFRKLGWIVICYKCNTIFRKARNVQEIEPFNHEMNDRIVYANHDFQGKGLPH